MTVTGPSGFFQIDCLHLYGDKVIFDLQKKNCVYFYPNAPLIDRVLILRLIHKNYTCFCCEICSPFTESEGGTGLAKTNQSLICV